MPQQIDHFATTTKDAEIISRVPILMTRRVVMRVPIDVLIGDLLVVISQVQITNDNPYNVGVWTCLSLVNDPSATAGVEISEASGRNITPGMHHDSHWPNGVIVCHESGPRYVNLTVHAGGGGKQKGHYVKIDTDYGRLNVLRIRGA